jgi:hypothetical protein
LCAEEGFKGEADDSDHVNEEGGGIRAGWGAEGRSSSEFWDGEVRVTPVS